VTESSHNLTGAKTILSVRALGATYLCLTDDSNTDFYTVFREKARLRLLLPCVVVCFLLKRILSQNAAA
jgi:hypothetical protein